MVVGDLERGRELEGIVRGVPRRHHGHRQRAVGRAEQHQAVTAPALGGAASSVGRDAVLGQPDAQDELAERVADRLGPAAPNLPGDVAGDPNLDRLLALDVLVRVEHLLGGVRRVVERGVDRVVAALGDQPLHEARGRPGTGRARSRAGRRRVLQRRERLGIQGRRRGARRARLRSGSPAARSSGPRSASPSISASRASARSLWSTPSCRASRGRSSGPGAGG